MNALSWKCPHKWEIGYDLFAPHDNSPYVYRCLIPGCGAFFQWGRWRCDVRKHLTDEEKELLRKHELEKGKGKPELPLGCK